MRPQISESEFLSLYLFSLISTVTSHKKIETVTFVGRTGNWPPNQSGAVCEKERTCRLSGTAHVGPNWRLQLTFAVEGGLLRVWNEQGTTTMDIVFVADEL